MKKASLSEDAILLEQTIALYKEHVYSDTYKDTDKEDAYIRAKLEELIDNHAPIRDFYKKLREDRKKRQMAERIKIIKAHQEKEQEKQSALAKEKARQKERSSYHSVGATQTFHPDYASSLAAEAALSSSSSLSYEVQQPKQKVKTKGVANPPAPLSSATPLAEEDPLLIDNSDPVMTITLSSRNYEIFASLVGLSDNRNISLADVKTLMTNVFGCRVTPGGSHGKLTAPNGQVWTIPNKEWDGVIPYYYRSQLNDFILNYLEIDPDQVQRQEHTVPKNKKKKSRQ